MAASRKAWTTALDLPEGSDAALVHAKVADRAAWIIKQQRQFQRYLPDVPPRQYVSGENHRYLGRQYRLRIEVAPADNVSITRQFLFVATADHRPAHVRGLVDAWYQARAREVFQARLQACHANLARFGIQMPALFIRPLTSSWGTCSAKGTITLNIKLIQVPLEYIDYVLIHELCHLQHLSHGPEFYKLLTRALPEWETRREKLNSFDFG